MTLPGLGALFLFGYVVAYTLAVDVVLLCKGYRSRWSEYAAIVVQVVLVGSGWTLAYLDEHPTDSMQAARKELRARGEQVEPGGVAALRDAFEKQHAWGTFESWLLLKGIENSALIHGGPSLPPEDRDALIALLKRDLAAARPRAAASHYYGFIEIKLLWDTLEPGNVAARLPRGTRLQVGYMLEFIDRYGSQRLCSVDGLAAADRVALDGALATGYTADVIADATRALDRLAEACRALRAGSS
jgi:hypothetical protein